MSRGMRWLAITGAVFTTLAMAVLIAVYVMLRPDRVTEALRSAARSTGLELTLGAPARPSLFPHPGLVLHGLVLTPIGSQTPMLMAARGRVELPWRVLLGSPAAITRLQLDAPRLDLAGLQQTLANLPSGDGQPLLPRIDTGISINNGVLVSGDRLLLDNINLHTGPLAPERPFHLQLSARGPDKRPYTLSLGMTPRTQPGVIHFDAVALHAHTKDGFAMALKGQAQWRGGADIELSLKGAVREMPDTDYTISLGLHPADATSPLTLAVKADGKETHADLHIPPLALGQWWSDLTGEDATAPLSPPPLSGHAEMNQLDLGAMKIEGLQIDAGTPPAPASTTAAKSKSKP
jgi:hypothetical protein